MDIDKVEKLLQDKIPIDGYFNKYIQPLKQGLTKINEGNPRSCCPFHDETDPSFGWWQEKKRFHCFGCGISGDIIRLHQLKSYRYEHRKLDKSEAINELISMYHLWDIPDVNEKLDEAKKSNKIAAVKEKMKNVYEAGFSNDALTLPRFEKMQRDIMKIPDIDRRINALEELDLMTCLVVARVVDNN